MKAKKLLTIFVAGAMMLSLVGCSGGAKKYEKAFDTLEYEKMEEYDEDDVEDDIEDGLYYSTKDEKEVKKICKIVPMEKVSAKNVSSIMFGGKSDDEGYFMVVSVTFKSKDDAQKCFDKNVKALEDRLDNYKDWYDKDEYDSDDGDDFFKLANVSYGGTYNEVIMDDSKTVTYIYGDFYYAEDSYDDYIAFYEAIDRECPVDMLKETPNSKKEHNSKINAVVDEIG